MKVKRYKRVRKLLQFYEMNYNFRPPYKVLLDGEFVQAALEGRILLREQIPKLLQDEKDARVFVTKCVRQDLQDRGKHYRGAFLIASELPHLRCRHAGIEKPDDCIRRFLVDGNTDKLMVGAQDVDLRKFVREQPGIPLLFIRGQVPIMESPTDFSKETSAETSAKKGSLTEEEKKVLHKVAPPPAAAPKKKKKGPKGPNPLSVKKPKKTPQPPPPKKRKAPEEKRDEAAAETKEAPESGVEPTKKSRSRARSRRKRQKTDGDSSAGSAAAPTASGAEPDDAAANGPATPGGNDDASQQDAAQRKTRRRRRGKKGNRGAASADSGTAITSEPDE